jgi:hypothetical protein
MDAKLVDFYYPLLVANSVGPLEKPEVQYSCRTHTDNASQCTNLPRPLAQESDLCVASGQASYRLQRL